jgi:hypothetical protein
MLRPIDLPEIQIKNIKVHSIVQRIVKLNKPYRVR